MGDSGDLKGPKSATAPFLKKVSLNGKIKKKILFFCIKYSKVIIMITRFFYKYWKTP